MIAYLLAFLLLFSPPVDDAALYKVAARCAGEARVVGVQGVYYCAVTVFDRMASPRYPDQVEQVLQAYFAPDLKPTAAELGAVRLAYLSPRGNFFFLYSRQDMRKLGLSIENVRTCVQNRRWMLCIP